MTVSVSYSILLVEAATSSIHHRLQVDVSLSTSTCSHDQPNNDNAVAVISHNSYRRKPSPKYHTSPSYKDNADTIVSSRLLPSLNSAISRLPFSSLSIMRKIFRTRFSGVSSSSGSLTMDP